MFLCCIISGKRERYGEASVSCGAERQAGVEQQARVRLEPWNFNATAKLWVCTCSIFLKYKIRQTMETFFFQVVASSFMAGPIIRWHEEARATFSLRLLDMDFCMCAVLFPMYLRAAASVLAIVLSYQD